MKPQRLVAKQNLRNWERPEEVAWVDTKSVDLRKLRDDVEEDSVRHEEAFLRQCVDYHLVPVAYHHGWHRAQHQLGKDLLVEVQGSTHRVDRDVVEGLRLT